MFRIPRFLLSLFVIFVVLEAGLRLFQKDRPAPELFRVFPADWVSKQAWYGDWVREHDELKRTFRAYEIYGLKPHSGRLISIDEEGYRKSWNPSVKGSPSVAFFGGSTLWGSWARDDFTIPSWFSRISHEKGMALGARNYGEVGFVFTQEFTRALRILSTRDDHPAFVFLDGVNDSLSSVANFAHGVDKPAGLPWEFDKYESLFALGKTGEISMGDIFSKFKVIRTSRKVLERMKLREVDPQAKGFWRDPKEKDLERLAEEVADTYLAWISNAERSIQAAGVRPLFILQPLLVYKKTPTSSERRLLDANLSWQNYLTAVYQRIRSRKPNFLLDYSELFSEEPEDMFSDIIHYSEDGNKKIAAQISLDLAAILEKKEISSKMIP